MSNEKSSKAFYARTDPDHPGRFPGDAGCAWQELREHVRNVAKDASPEESFTKAALWAGLLHDIGKYSDAFQEMLLSTAKGEPKRKVEHSGHGAAIAERGNAFDVAFAVANHHAGLSTPQAIKNRTARLHQDVMEIRERALKDLDSELAGLLASEIAPFPKDMKRAAVDLRIRMLTSCLIDADRLDASGLTYGPWLLSDTQARLERLLVYVRKRAERVQEGCVKDARRDVLMACLASAECRDRLLSLTVPTGGGKTLSSMAFALKRALLRPAEVRRIIVVIPFLSIIEQNASVYAEAIGEDAIVEHHSGEFWQEIDEDEFLVEEKARHKLAVENWNAPIIVTTSVRFFESLFSSRPSDLRRLHNLAHSVVILDEVQTLPRNFLRAILSVLNGLASDWGTTFIFCTATQPAFEKPLGASQKDIRWAPGTVREILPTPQRHFDNLKRTAIFWPGTAGYPGKCSWDQVADWLTTETRGLCVVNLKEHARLLYRKLVEREEINHDHLWHLSTRMCPQHRLDVLESIRSTLAEGAGPCRVVSTQLVEAGVDLDFPVVFRAMAPLDSIAQAAGRCDREGKLTEARGSPAGRVVVFEPDLSAKKATPPGAYTDATEITRIMRKGCLLSIHDTAHIRGYFDRYYQTDLDPQDIEALRMRLDFPEVANRFHLIEKRTTSVIVPYGDEALSLLNSVEERRGFDMNLRRRLQRYQIGLYQNEFIKARQNGAIFELIEGSEIWSCDSRFYSGELGFEFECDEPLIV